MPRPSRIIFHYFHDTLFKLQLFSIPTLFSRFFYLSFPSRFPSFSFTPFSRFHFFLLLDHSFTHGISLPVFPFISSLPYLIYNIPVRHSSQDPSNSRIFTFLTILFLSSFVQPNYPRSIILCRFHIQISNFIVSNLPNIDKSRRSNFQFFKFSNFHLNSPEFPNHYLLISFPIPFPFVRKNTRRLKKSSPSDGWKRSRIISRAKPLLHPLFCSNQHG